MSCSSYDDHSRRFRWSKIKIGITGICFIISSIYIFTQIYPFFKGEHEAKDIGGIFFSIFHIYMIISVFKINTNSSFLFFILTYVMLLSITACFIFYESWFLNEDDEEEGGEEKEEEGGDNEEEK